MLILNGVDVLDACEAAGLPIGQLLLHHLRFFREQLLEAAAARAGDAAFELRMPHLHVFGNIKADGTRLTDLASSTGMTRPSMAALVDELEHNGLLERRPDPADKRAKLILLTPAGWDAFRTGREIIQGIERDYAQRIGDDRFEAMCRALQDLLDDLQPRHWDAKAVPRPGESSTASGDAPV